jgi:histidinol-phosphate aminotransferase
MKYIRENILALHPYSSARDEFSGDNGIFLDANENPFGNLNRYPDPYQRKLKQNLSKFKNIETDKIFIGNGSDEVIDLAFRVFCEPKKDKIIICPPTYGMYEVSANINNVEIIKIPLLENFQLDIDNILKQKAKVLFICSPNNPTGNNLQNIEKLIENFDGIVFVDEAYIDFSSKKSLIEKIKNYQNLIVSQTFSKAWGLAAARVGVAYSNPEIINVFNKVKPPYNVSKLNQKAAIKALENKKEYLKNLENILDEKNNLIQKLSKNSLVKKIYPSDANFLLIEVSDANFVYEKLIEKKIIIRNRNAVIKNCVRITIGTKDENQQLIEELKKINSLK